MTFPQARATPNLRLTPRNSPAPKSPSPKSPAKAWRENPVLSLNKVLGNTVSSSNALDSLETSAGNRCFVVTAGSVASLFEIGENSEITQRCFRARPSAGLASASTDPSTPTPTPQGSRYRQSILPREAASPLTPWGSSFQEPPDSPTFQKSGNVRERTKPTTCVSLSSDGKWLAVGEVGYRPRILIFSTSKDASTDVPRTSLTEHTFGVKCLAFSPDSTFLASLGDVNDGFLHVWTINPRTGAATMYARNKCTSNVRSIAWMGDKLISVGTRHVKIWRPEKLASAPSSSRFGTPERVLDTPSRRGSPSWKLSGRNCLLGSLLDKSFTKVVPTTFDKAIVCSSEGDVCLVHDNNTSPSFSKVAECSFGINSAAILGRSLLVGGKGGQIQLFELSQLLEDEWVSEAAVYSEEIFCKPVTEGADLIAMAPLGRELVVVDSERSVQIVEPFIGRNRKLENRHGAYRFHAHSAAVLGITAYHTESLPSSAFLTYSANGSIRIWSHSGSCLKEMTVASNEVLAPDEQEVAIRAVKGLEKLARLVVGDIFGILRIIEISSGRETFKAQGHAGEITGIALYENDRNTLVSSASKDRMIQVFRTLGDSFELLQTLDDHVGSVTGICFSPDGKKLLSCSPDRSVILREAVTAEVNKKERTYYLLSKTINLKSTPSSIQMAGSENSFLVSTVDKHILKYSLDSGKRLISFKTADQEDGDAISLGSVVAVSGTPKTAACLAGVANADKSIRVYAEEGRLVGLEYGHTEGLTGITLLSDLEDRGKLSLVSVATDGTVFMWSLCLGDAPFGGVAQTDLGQGTPKANAFFSSGPPLRRALSSSELTQLQGLRLDEGTLKSKGRSRSPLRETSNDTASWGSNQKTDASRRAVNRSDDTGVQSSTGRKKSTSGMSSRQPSPPSARYPRQSTANGRTLRRQSSYPVMGNNESQKSTGGTVRRRKSVSSETSGTSLTSMNPGHCQNSLRTASSQISQSMRSFRHHLTTSRDVLPAESAKELERELTQTAKALAEKAARNEAVMAQLLDRYTDQIVNKLDERIKDRVMEGLRDATPRPAGAGERIDEEVESEAQEDCSRSRSSMNGLM